MIKKKKIVEFWRKKAEIDPDFRVILAGHEYGRNLNTEIRIDADETYNAIEELDKLGIIEKGEL
jgi:predicted hydrocarbon binding protein